MKKILSLLLSAAMAVMCFAGCNSGNSTSSSSASGSSASGSSASSSSDSASDAGASVPSSSLESSAPEDAGTITVIDHADREVILPKEVNRVVVTDVYPMASVLAVFLGSADKLVGIHPVCMSAAKNGLLGELFPEILEADTGFMTGSDLNIEELMKLEPDVVFCTAANSTLISALENAGITAVGISPSKFQYDILETYDQWIALLSQIFPESDKAEAISKYSREIYDRIQQKVASLPEEERKKVLFLFQYDETQMVTSGRNFFGQFWCEAVGAVNAAEEVAADNSNAVITMEQVYGWDPDLIFITNFTPTQPADLMGNKVGADDWSTVKAVQDGEVYKLPLGTYRSYTPSSDTPVTLLWMAQKVYPDLFEDVDMTAEVRDYYQELYGVALTDEQIGRMYNPASAGAESFR